MSWYQIKLAVAGQFADTLSDYCLELGAISAVLDNAGADTLAEAVLEPDPGATIVWENVVISTFWPISLDIGEVSAALKEYLKDGGIFAEVNINFVSEEQLPPVPAQPTPRLCFGDNRLWLVPRDLADLDAFELEALAETACIKLDPGLAFGSGLHPTTQLCIDYLARLPTLAGSRVLDFGCGSGVLALAALALGASLAHGVDHDPQALVATRDNAAYNDVGDALQVFTPSELPDDAHYEVVVANILANPLIELAPLISDRVAPGGRLIMAGLLHGQAAAVSAAYPGFEFAAPQIYNGSAVARMANEQAPQVNAGGMVATPQEDWVCLAGQKAQA